jgi:hypothetical protein
MAYEGHFVQGLDKMSKTIQEHKLIYQECETKSFVMSRVTKKMHWDGCAPYEVPIQTGFAGEISMEECLPEDPYKGAYDKMVVTGDGEIHGTLCVDERQLRKYKTMNKMSYISLIGDDLSRISRRMTRYVDRGLLLGGSVDEITSNPKVVAGAAANTLPPGDAVVPGSLFVKCPKSFSKGAKYEIVSDSIPTPLTVYVTSVNANDSYIVLQTNPLDGSAAVPAVVAPYVLADNPKLLPCGYTVQKNCGRGFCSLDENLGFDGSTHHFGVERASTPILQGDSYDLTESTAATIIKDFLQVFYMRAEDCADKNMEVLVPYQLFGILVKELENSKDRTNQDKDALIGYRTLTFCLPEGNVKVTAVPKMPADCAYILDWSSWMWLGDRSPMDPHSPSNQPSWYRERGCNYLYFKDLYFNGKLVSFEPCKNAKINLDPAKYLVCV